MILKEPDLYYQTLYQDTADVIQIHQYHEGRITYAYVQVVTGDGGNAVVMYEGDTGSIVQGSTVRIVGLPVCEWDFANVSGGQTQAILFDGVAVKKP